MIELNKIYNEDCRETMKRMPDNFVDSIVTDPPYELSDDGKASPNRVFLEFIFPQKKKTKAVSEGIISLEFLFNNNGLFQ